LERRAEPTEILDFRKIFLHQISFFFTPLHNPLIYNDKGCGFFSQKLVNEGLAEVSHRHYLHYRADVLIQPCPESLVVVVE